MKRPIFHLIFKRIFLISSILIISSLLIRCEQPSLSINDISNLYNFPNPFSPTGEDDNYKTTTIRAEFSNMTSVTKAEITVSIRDYDDSLVWTFNREIELSGTQGNENIDVIWSGTNNLGNYVSQGIYKTKFHLKVLETASNEIGGDILTENIKIAVQ
jgi:hypothetical protein